MMHTLCCKKKRKKFTADDLKKSCDLNVTLRGDKLCVLLRVHAINVSLIFM